MQSVVLAVLMAIGTAATAEQDAAPAAQPNGSIRLDETVISGNQELPKVLYIVPWQDPTGIPTIQLDPTFTEHEVFRRVYPPAYQRELQYYDLLKDSERSEGSEGPEGKE
jgi:hypothetical protein